ncbi:MULTISPECIES: GcrA family cell cycle regulator [Inquilinus]|jgi:GcrA cell cycle regulator|uniref:GcrA cell cycle regulator n=1 Tax=Inquilinus ginsengisoli TaxID=363840 RepID=A0ABU1JIP1_9PROT|nr:GcrA family cell cycle regulator [Inquilinus ginsengisoli]MDR6288482.1 GcrA cell cycle regulator [Inquilinus ginsengisoli]
MSWTDERVTQLRQLWGNGKSASEIAEILGGVSRNAVIGKAHRLELSGRPSPIKRKEDEEEETVVAVETAAPVAAKVAVRPAPERKSGGATILNLTERMCKWPIGDPRDKDFHFCGKAAHGNLPYCAEHAAIAYQPPGKRRDEERTIIMRA